MQLATIQELARYWATEYDWRRCEARLNALPQFTTGIDGVDVHFIHVKSPHENAMPLIITHGWPGSVIELLEVASPLTDPAAHGGRAGDAFDLVPAPQSAQSGQEHAAPDALATFRASGFGYFLEQATRPQTIGYALLDSPVALAAWMIRAPRGVLAHPGRRPSYEWPRPPAPDASRWFRLLPDELYPDLPAAGQGGQFAWKKLAS